MPVKKIEFANFKGQSGSYELPSSVKVQGMNGVGKTLIRDVIAFGFCGTDSYGTRNPTHLISTNEDNMKVVLDTGRSIFTRTLTRKGNGSIKVEVAGVATNYNQTQLEEKIGRVDTFLSVLVPGYFFKLSESKKQEVLSDVLPKVDRLALIQEVSGLTITEEESALYGFNRRYDLIASSVSNNRRTYERAISEKNGQVTAYKSEVVPVKPDVVDYDVQIKDLEDLKTANTKYESYLENKKAAETHNAKIDTETARIQKEIADVMTEIKFYESKLQAVPEIKETDEQYEERIKLLRNQFQSEPKEPAMFNLITQDNCSSCGQMVSERHRDNVRAQNEQLKNEYLNNLENVKAFNKTIQDQISAANTERQALVKNKETIVNNNRDYKSKMQGFENKKAALKLPTPMELPKDMEKPVAYNLEKHLELKDLDKKQNEKLGGYNSALAAYSKNQEKIAKIELELKENQETYDRLFKLEEALKKIPSIELERQAGLFNTESLKFNGELVLLNNVPYQMLSTGERMSIDLYFSRKINHLWARSHKVIFVDDADLISNDTYLKVTNVVPDANESQEIRTYVTDGSGVTISGNE